MSSSNKVFQITDYIIFDTGIKANDEIAKKLEELAAEIKECGGALSEDVFSGPASDAILEAIPSLEEALSTYGVHLMGRLNKRLKKVASNYIKADKDANKTITNV